MCPFSRAFYLKDGRAETMKTAMDFKIQNFLQ